MGQGHGETMQNSVTNVVSGGKLVKAGKHCIYSLTQRSFQLLQISGKTLHSFSLNPSAEAVVRPLPHFSCALSFYSSPQVPSAVMSCRPVQHPEPLLQTTWAPHVHM